MTNENGEFQIEVPAGRYIVRIVDGGRAFNTVVFSYEDPNEIQIKPGGCAQIEFAEAESPSAR
jgi:hypothetical protein